MLFDLVFIFAPLLGGYLIPKGSSSFNQIVNRAVMILIYLMLGLLGVSFSTLDDFSHQFSQVVIISVTFFISISIVNLLFLPWLDRTTKIVTNGKSKTSARMAMFKDSIFLILTVVSGAIIAFTLPFNWHWVNSGMEWALFLLLVLIGIQLRASGLSLREILLNINGLKIALIVIFSSWIGGSFAGYFLGIPLYESLAMSSGFGWYSLSGILIGKELGPLMGAASFMLELGREMVALVLLPVLIRRRPLTGVGYAGATAMDFTLPIIQLNGGINCVPIAIVSGFLLSICVPLFMLMFLSLAA
ncbi:lysine exporter LysO family protein [Vibrio sp. WJH972]